MCQDDKRATLPCLHPVCLNCYAAKNATDEYECVYVRENLCCHHKYHKGDVLVEDPAPSANENEQQQQQPRIPLCDLCEEFEASHRCDVCDMLLCMAEAKSHAKLSKGHRVSRLALPPEAPAPPPPTAIQNPCETHKTVAATLYCKQCSKLMCNECVNTHSGHVIQSLTDGLAHRAQLITTKLAALQKRCNEHELDEVIADLSYVTAHIAATNSKIDEAFDRVSQPLRQLADSIDQRKLQFRRDAQEQIGADVKALERQVDLILTFKHDVEFVRAAAVGSVSSAAQALVSARLLALDKVAVNCKTSVTETSYFSYAQPMEVARLLDAVKAVPVGQLGSMSKRALRAPEHPVATADARDYRLIDAPVRLIGSKGSETGEMKNPTGLSVSAGVELVVADYNNSRVQIFHKTDGNHLRFIHCGFGVFGVSVAPSGDVWISNNSKDLRLYSPQTGTLVRSVAVLSFFCASLADGSVLVSKNNNKVGLVNAAGVRQWESSGEGLSQTWGVCDVPSIQAVAVCDYGNKHVQVLSAADGRHINSIGTGLLNDPRSLAFDAAAQVLIIGERDKVSAWTLGGELVHQWAQGTIDVAYGVTVDPGNSTMYVSDHKNHRILVF